jgi:hypothetical protein
MFSCPVGNRDADTMSPQISPDFPTAIRLVAYDSTRTVFRPTPAASFHRTAGYHRFEPNGFVPLPWGQHEGH